ncbi:MAG: response regulator [Armatimonadetes bacterium]|nr:response regulator [Armatimonadota bacterium]
MKSPTRYVVIEDELAIRRFLRASLPSGETEFFEAETGEAGIQLVAQKNPDIVLLDLGLPDMDGLEVLRRIREWSNVPIIILSARGQEKDKIGALDAGANDYLTKPFSYGELMARVRVALRYSERDNVGAAREFAVGDLRIDFEARQVFVAGQEVRVTPIEFKLLLALARHPGKVLTHNQLLREVWGAGYTDSTHTLRVHMGSIRQKIEKNPSQPLYIRTETGVGYRMLAD